MSGADDDYIEAGKSHQSIIDFRVLRLERDHEDLKIEFRVYRDAMKDELSALERRIVDELRIDRDGLGKAFERGMLVIVAIISALGIYLHHGP